MRSPNDIEPANVWQHGKKKTKASLAGPFKGLPLIPTDKAGEKTTDSFLGDVFDQNSKEFISSQASDAGAALRSISGDDGGRGSPASSTQVHDPQEPNTASNRRAKPPMLRVNTSSSKNSDGKKNGVSKLRSQPIHPSRPSKQDNESPIPDYHTSAQEVFGYPEPDSISDIGSDTDYDIRTFVRASDLKTLINGLRVKQRLLPAMLLLSHWHRLHPPEILEAGQHASESIRLAKDCHVSPMLQARCTFYFAFAESLLTDKDENGLIRSRSGGRRAESVNSLDSDREDKTCLHWFEQASAAEGEYKEGKWAREWVDYLKSAQEISPSALKRPPSATGRFVNKVWSAVWGRKPTSPGTVLGESSSEGGAMKPRPMLARSGGAGQLVQHQRLPKSQGGSVSSCSSNNHNHRAGGGEVIPDFTTLGSDVDSRGRVLIFETDSGMQIHKR